MIDHDDMLWLKDRRPDTDAPDAFATERARAALTDHPRPRSRRRRRLLPLAGLAAAAAAAGLLIGMPTSDENGSVAVAAPLTLLAQQVATAPEPTGDATLVHRSHEFGDGRPGFTGVDLYTDAGPYYYGITQKAMERSLDAGEAIEPSMTAKALRAIAASAELSPDQARDELLEAVPLPEGAPPAKAKGGVPRDTEPSVSDLRARTENWLWINAMDSLIAGGGNPDVRAGAMQVLASITTVSVDPAELGGREVLELRNTGFSDGYVETLLLDAKTGVILQLRGGNDEQRPDVVVSYDISRVDVADIR